MGVDGFPERVAAYEAWTAATGEATEEIRHLLGETLEAVAQRQTAMDVGRHGEHSGNCSHPVARAFDRVLPLSALAVGRNGSTLEPVEALVLLSHFGLAQDPLHEADPADTQMVAAWLESLRTDVPPPEPEPEYILPPLTEDELVVDIDGNPDLGAALEQWTATTANATWDEQAHSWLSLVRVVETGDGMTPKDEGPPMLQAFSSLAHELWRVGKARKLDRPPFSEQRLNQTVSRVGAMLMLRHFGELGSGRHELPPIPDTGLSK